MKDKYYNWRDGVAVMLIRSFLDKDIPYQQMLNVLYTAATMLEVAGSLELSEKDMKQLFKDLQLKLELEGADITNSTVN